MAIASEAALTALDCYMRSGGGSRGARAICDPKGELTPITQKGPLTEFRFRPKRAPDREKQIFVRHENSCFSCEIRPIAAVRDELAFFERDWPRFLSGPIYGRSV